MSLCSNSHNYVISSSYETWNMYAHLFDIPCESHIKVIRGHGGHLEFEENSLILRGFFVLNSIKVYISEVNKDY